MICGKVIYQTRDLAISALNGISSDKRPVRSKKQAGKAYFCDECSGFHISTEGKPRGHTRRIKSFRVNQAPLFNRRPQSFGHLTIHKTINIK